MYLPLGMEVTKIHRILKFKQLEWLKLCINFNTEKTENAANSFGKYFLKVMNNSVYGETMEHLRERINVRLVNNAKEYKNM